MSEKHAKRGEQGVVADDSVEALKSGSRRQTLVQAHTRHSPVVHLAVIQVIKVPALDSVLLQNEDRHSQGRCICYHNVKCGQEVPPFDALLFQEVLEEMAHSYCMHSSCLQEEFTHSFPPVLPTCLVVMSLRSDHA